MINNRKKNDTLQYLVKFSEMIEKTDPVLLDTINFFKNKTYDEKVYNEKGQLNIDILTKLLKENKKYRLQLDNITVILSQLALGVREGFYDEYVAWFSNNHRIINATNALIPYFSIREKEENYTPDKDMYCCCLRIMVDSWKNNRSGKYGKWQQKDIMGNERLWEYMRRMEEESKKNEIEN